MMSFWQGSNFAIKKIMAEMEKMVPHILLWETGTAILKGESFESLFERASKRGYACDPDDRGGATMCGVTYSTFRQYRRSAHRPDPSVEELRRIDFREWLDILKSAFWDKWHADEIRSQRVAEILVDWIWMSGPAVIRMAQKILGVAQDGIVGPQTVAAINECDAADGSDALVSRLREARISHIEEICRSRPRNLKFRTGWLRRVEAICDNT